ncbi:hypothetical protein ACHAWF_002852 [Thalassiosira exigua]
MIPPTTPRLGRRAAEASLLSALVLGYGAILYFGDDAMPVTEEPRRSLQLETAPEGASDERVLAMTGTSPPALDEIAGEYIVKPWVGYASTNIYETTTAIIPLDSAQSSSVEGGDYLPRFAIEPHPQKWMSSSLSPAGTEEWVQIDTGYPQQLSQIDIQWDDSAYAASYSVEVGPERLNCRSNGGACADYWIPVASVTGKADSSATTHDLSSYDAPQGVRYIRLRMIERAAGRPNFSIYLVRAYRKKEVVGETPTGTYCGDTTAAVTNALLTRHGGGLIQTYEASEFFHASMTSAQAAAMNADACTFVVEPNYKVYARGRTVRGAPKQEVLEPPPEPLGYSDAMHRNLAIPEFNMRDESPQNWGLERISSHGRRNGKYMWFHEGEDTHVYMFDTGIYPDHVDWQQGTRSADSRLQAPLVCAGTETDYALNDHGTHMASLAAGWTYGTGKSATVHPIQVLDGSGEGTTATYLCGVERVVQNALDYVTANPEGEKYQAVINLSLGVNGRSDIMDKAVQEMTAAGYMVVIAAGDDNSNACNYSPMHSSALRVGALNDSPQGFNNKTATSNFGSCIDVWAPGEDIVGASNEGEYDTATKSGTSVAAAFAAGATTLFLESTNTDELLLTEVAAFVKEKILAKAENYILNEIGPHSPGRMLQTTVSKCTLNSHCEAGLTCLFDGTCRDLSKPLKSEAY